MQKKSKLITRRKMIELCFGTLAAVAAGDHFFRARARRQGFSFIVANDLHYTNAECESWFERVTAQMKQSAPNADLCLLVGDLTAGGTRLQLNGLRDAFMALEIPVFTVPGNHDYQSDGTSRNYEQVFPGRRNYWFEHRGWQFIGLDSCDGTDYKNISMRQETLDWLDSQLPALKSGAPTIVFTHFPVARGVQWCLGNVDELLKRFRDIDLRAVFSGHWHGLSQHHHRGALLITNRCCGRAVPNLDGSSEKGWLVCQVVNGRLKYKFVPLRLT